MVSQKENSGSLKLHGIWFNIRSADVQYLESSPQDWVIIDDIEGEKILSRLER